MNVGHLVFRADSLTYTVARALTVAGHDVHVWIVDPEFESRPASRMQSCLYATPRVTIIPRLESRLPRQLDHLVVQMYPRPEECIRDLDRVASRAAHITLISAGDRSRSWRQSLRMQWPEVARLARYASRIDRVVYKDGYYSWDLYRPLVRRSVVGFDVHSQFLHDPDNYAAIHARDWDPARIRPIRANFLGSQDPDVRKRILDAVRPLFIDGDAEPTSASLSKRMYWHEYSDASPAALSPSRFLGVLVDSDFTLCPTGYSLVTHRPMEALLRGSIPVISERELDLYDIGLRDGVNCIAVADSRWREAVRRLAAIGEDELFRMRHAAREMCETLLDYPVSAARMRQRLGIADLASVTSP
jgi:hypothetical protein